MTHAESQVQLLKQQLHERSSSVHNKGLDDEPVIGSDKHLEIESFKEKIYETQKLIYLQAMR
jgi:hypothetical protein